jgi:hypothetical protein
MPKLNVGDKVKIINVRNCQFGCNPSMLKLNGKTTVITGVTDNYMGRAEYKIKIDYGIYIWSANCLEPVKCKFIIKNE